MSKEAYIFVKRKRVTCSLKTAYGKIIQDIKHQTKERFEWIERNIQVDPIKQKNSCGSYARRKQRGSLFERRGKDFDRSVDLLNEVKQKRA